MKYIAMGELMLRLTPPAYDRLIQAQTFKVSFGGAEANVLLSLAVLGQTAAFVSKVPDNDVGRAALHSLQQYGVDVNRVLLGGSRLGIYFNEPGVSLRPGKVLYDRKGSAFAEAGPEEFCWSSLLDGFDWYHITGITPALSDSAAEFTLQSVRCAKEKGMTVSCDLNYRSALWSREKAGTVMNGILPFCDLIITNPDQAADVLGLFPQKGVEPDSEAAAIELSEKIAERFSCRFVAHTLRRSPSATSNELSGYLYDAESRRLFTAPKYTVSPIVDRIGGGDSFAGGLLYALGAGNDPDFALRFAVAAEALKHTVNGDYNLCTVEEIRRLMDSDGSVRVLR